MVDIQLKDFVADSLKQIIDGVLDAQEYAASKNSIVKTGDVRVAANSNLLLTGDGRIANLIEFDIAVSASERSQTQGGVGAALVTVLSASLKGETEVSNATVSRIKFGIPLVLPKQMDKY